MYPPYNDFDMHGWSIVGEVPKTDIYFDKIKYKNQKAEFHGSIHEGGSDTATYHALHDLETGSDVGKYNKKLEAQAAESIRAADARLKRAQKQFEEAAKKAAAVKQQEENAKKAARKTPRRKLKLKQRKESTEVGGSTLRAGKEKESRVEITGATKARMEERVQQYDSNGKWV